jgi:hypothetical protein
MENHTQSNYERMTKYRLKSKWSYVLCLIFLQLLFSILADANELNNEFPPSTYQSLYFLNNSTECYMYSDSCLVKLVSNDKPIVREYLKTISEDEEIIQFKSIVQCKNPNNTNPSKKSNRSNIIRSCDSMYNLSETFKKSNSSISKYFYLVHIKANLIGIKNIQLVYNANNKNITLNHKVIVKTPERFIDQFQLVYVVFFSIIMSFIMGILLDIETLMKILKMPLPVIIGFISQYGFMPLLTYGFIKIFKLSPVESLALFIYGTSPGGSGSNNWTIIFDGDIDLSAIMTFVSTMSSLCNFLFSIF